MRPLGSTLFPYTTLFRSSMRDAVRTRGEHGRRAALVGAAALGALLLGGLAFEQECAKGRRSRSESTRLNSSHVRISYAVFCLKKKTTDFEPKCRVLYVRR